MRSILAALALVLLAGCATTANTGNTGNNDPFEPVNRKVYAFNDAVDRAVLKPVATGYKKVAPAPVQTGVNNFFDNIYDVNTTLNQFLQGKPKEGFSDAARFLFNTVFGVFGLFDVATPLGLDKHDEDFGQTLGVWGVPAGPYVVIPFLGPSSARDAPAKLVDLQWYYPRWLDNDTAYWSLWVTDKVRTRANLLQAGNVLEQAALDPYVFLRDAWMQRRRSQVYDGHPPRQKYEDEEDTK